MNCGKSCTAYNPSAVRTEYETFCNVKCLSEWEFNEEMEAKKST